MDPTDGEAAVHRRIESVNPDTFTAMMEQLQEGYVASVAATAGCAFERSTHDIYGFDTSLVRPGKTPSDEEVTVYAQLKCTTTSKPDPTVGAFSFKLKKREYFERLAKPRRTIKALLIVMVTSPRQAEWSDASHDTLALSHCCYWVHLEGQVANAGVRQPTVQVPTANVFDAVALTEILDKIDRGEPLNEI